MASSGNVGVGHVAPSEKLVVVGCIKHNAGTLGTSCSSDERLKDHIKDIDYGKEFLNIFTLLRPRTYVYRDNYEQTYYGFVAQEIRDIDPSLLGENNKDGYMTVNYEAIKWLHFKASQDNVRSIASLKDEVSNLRNKLDKKDQELEKVKSENELVKAYLCQKDSSAAFCK